MDLSQAYDYLNLSQLMKKLGLDGHYIKFKYLKGLVNTKISMFKYKNLPGSLTSEILETALMFNNHLCFYKSETFGIVLCRYLPLGEFDIYWKPTHVDLLALNGKTIATKVPYEDIVLVRDNECDIIPFLWILEFIEVLERVEDTLMKNMLLLQLPIIFTGKKEQINTYKQLIKKTLNIDPFAIADKETIDSLKQFDINLPVKLDEILSVYKNYKNMCLESEGIYGTETQKKERLLVGEVQSQTEYVDYNYQGFKRMRLDFIDEVKKKFDYDIELEESYVEFREQDIELQNQLVNQFGNQNEGGNGNAE